MRADILKIVKRVHEIFNNSGFSLSVAESCTGGLISSYLTDLPGASSFFIAGVVSYSEKAKMGILGVSSATIGKYGVVSAETAQEMAERMRIMAKTDYTLAATGNLGPDALEGKEKGLVYIAAGKEGKTISRELKLKGDREANKEDTVLEALRLLVEMAEGKQ